MDCGPVGIGSIGPDGSPYPIYKSCFSDWTFLDPALRSMILSFDAYLTVPDVRPSTSLQAVQTNGHKD